MSLSEANVVAGELRSVDLYAEVIGWDGGSYRVVVRVDGEYAVTISSYAGFARLLLDFQFLRSEVT